MSEAAAHAADVATSAADHAGVAADAAQGAADDAAQAVEVAAAHAGHAPVAVADSGGADMHQALGRIEARVEALHGRMDSLAAQPAVVHAPDPVDPVEVVEVPATPASGEEVVSESKRRGVGFKRGK